MDRLGVIKKVITRYYSDSLIGINATPNLYYKGVVTENGGERGEN